MKIDHLISRAPQKLSGGEKRNVAIAAVLAMNPDVLLLTKPAPIWTRKAGEFLSMP
jgi:energy-coupling factor transporter ATP-binding protein EcfA2